MWNADTKLRQQPIADEGNAAQDHPRQKAGIECDAPILSNTQTTRERSKYGCQAHRVDHCEQRHEAGDQKIECHGAHVAPDA